MELLLFISALLTSLTGAFTGTRAAEVRQVEASADYVEASVEVIAQAGEIAAVVMPAKSVPVMLAQPRLSQSAPLPSRSDRFERLLE